MSNAAYSSDSKDMTTVYERELRHSAGTYFKRDLEIVRGEGVYVYDRSGRRYLDAIAGIGTASIGHAHPRLASAIAEQAGQIVSLHELLCSEVRASFQEELLASFPGKVYSRVFLSNSGAESVEAALKFVRYKTGRPGIAALNLAYHGKTMGALSVTFDKKYQKPFAPLIPGVKHVSSHGIDALIAAFDEADEQGLPIGCFIFEAIQGESGVIPLSAEFLKGAVEVVRERGALVVADEIQCGVGRTGEMWGFSQAGVEPDIICVAKGIAGGVPLAATVLHERVGEFPARVHTSTFGGNPLSCRAGLEVLSVIKDEGLVENARDIGNYFVQRISEAKLARVREIRGRGLMIGVELKEKAGPFVRDAASSGLLCLLAGQRVIRLLPPLTLSKAEADEVADVLIQILR